MSQMLEIPDRVYAEIQEEAEARGLTPIGWIVSHLVPTPNANVSDIVPKPATMAERLAGRIGRISSGTGEPSSDNVAEHFAEYLEEKQRQGRL